VWVSDFESTKEVLVATAITVLVVAAMTGVIPFW
jgi:hypothetical protein